MDIGLRIDVDTFRGTKLGVPSLCEALARHGIQATFFFTVGPDNMGRHLWRLLRPRFFWKMLRTKASRLYGWDILLRGTFWPGPIIGQELAGVIHAVAEAGHEIGFHAWDHHAWQVHIDSMTAEEMHRSLALGVESLTRILGHAPTCSAVAGWRCNDLVLEEKAKFNFRYNSDCRGDLTFHPIVGGRELAQPQVPVNLPTYDEMIGQDGVTDANYNDRLLALCRPGQPNVLTIHAEVEGIACRDMFADFLKQATTSGARLMPLGKLLEQWPPTRTARIVQHAIPGREGWVAIQDATGPRAAAITS